MSKKENPNYYAVLPAIVRYAKITAIAKLLYCELTTLTIKEGFAWVSNQYLANIYGVHKITVSKGLAELQDKGFIKCEYDNTSSNNTKRKIYLIDIDKKSISENTNTTDSISNNANGSISDNANGVLVSTLRGVSVQTKGVLAPTLTKEIQDEELKINDIRSCYRRLEELLPDANTIWVTKIDKYADKLPVSLITKAIEETIVVTRNPKYFCAICDDYILKGYKTLQEVEEASRQFKAKKKEKKEQDDELKRKSKQAYIDDVEMKKNQNNRKKISRNEYDEMIVNKMIEQNKIKSNKPPD